MEKENTKSDLDLLEENVKLRLNVVKKKIERYFKDLESAQAEDRPLPLPEVSEE